jgi:SAM-dependent methyltransferase
LTVALSTAALAELRHHTLDLAGTDGGRHPCAPTMTAGREHWEQVYASRAADQVSWFQRVPEVSLALVRQAGIEPGSPIVDVGAGASTLVDELLVAGYSDATLLDLSDAALQVARARMGAAPKVKYVAGDVTQWEPPRQFALWHDRAVFHFLVDDAARAAYRRTLAKALGPRGKAILATFALDGPERCSGLPVRRYSVATLAAELGDVLSPLDTRQEVHVTPSGAKQSFVYVLFKRLPSSS